MIAIYRKRVQRLSLILFIIFLSLYNSCLAKTCSGFSAWTAPSIKSYQKTNRIYPIPDHLKKQAIEKMPRLWVHPKSFLPINFEHYLSDAKIAIINDDETETIQTLSNKLLEEMTFDEKCHSYIIPKKEIVEGSQSPPVYIQVYQDTSPFKNENQPKWFYFKYTWVFDWSGLAADLDWFSQFAAELVADDIKKWHRLDVHTSAIVAVDETMQIRLLSTSQHNHLKTYIAGIDFPLNQKPNIAAAMYSNELYLDTGKTTPERYRAISYFDDIEYLIDNTIEPFINAFDIVYGKNNDAIEINSVPNFISPDNPLAEFPGLLAPPNQLLDRFYIGRDGPPGYDYYAAPDITPLANYVSVGYWQENDLELLKLIKPLIDVPRIKWEEVINIMNQRLRTALQSVDRQD